MAKKKVEEPVYPESPLVITRDQFCSLLKEQITKGDELLKVSVPVARQAQQGYYGFGSVSRGRDRVDYDDDAEKEFIANYSRWNDRNKAIYRTSFEAPESIYYHEYESHIWSNFWGDDNIKDYKDQIKRLNNHMQGDIERSDLFKCNAETPAELSKVIIREQPVLSNDIFIVHGHNEEMKQAVARVVTKLGLNPIILHEQPNGGKTIIEKFECNAADISFAIILLSADDMAGAVRDIKGVKDDNLRDSLEMRARQNVVYEMGYFTGKLGRSNVFYLLQEGVAKPGDLDGIVYTSYDTAMAWRFELVKELKNAGYRVSADQVL